MHHSIYSSVYLPVYLCFVKVHPSIYKHSIRLFVHLTDCAKLFLADISGLCQIQSYKSILEIHLLDIEEQN